MICIRHLANVYYYAHCSPFWKKCTVLSLRVSTFFWSLHMISCIFVIWYECYITSKLNIPLVWLSERLEPYVVIDGGTISPFTLDSASVLAWYEDNCINIFYRKLISSPKLYCWRVALLEIDYLLTFIACPKYFRKHLPDSGRVNHCSLLYQWDTF